MAVISHPEWGYLVDTPAQGVAARWSRSIDNALDLSRDDARQLITRHWPENENITIEVDCGHCGLSPRSCVCDMED